MQPVWPQTILQTYMSSFHFHNPSCGSSREVTQSSHEPTWYSRDQINLNIILAGELISQSQTSSLQNTMWCWMALVYPLESHRGQGVLSKVAWLWKITFISHASKYKSFQFLASGRRYACLKFCTLYSCFPFFFPFSSPFPPGICYGSHPTSQPGS